MADALLGARAASIRRARQRQDEDLRRTRSLVGGQQQKSQGQFTRQGPSPSQDRRARRNQRLPTGEQGEVRAVDAEAFIEGRSTLKQRENDANRGGRGTPIPDTFTAGKGFIAGRGISLQPLGFNLPLATFQDTSEEGIFGFERRKRGGFAVHRRDLPHAIRVREKKGKTLLTGRIRRRKLTRRGTTRPPEFKR
jgi:hypothetical protein